MQQGTPSRSSATLDADEIDRFARLSSEWWDQRGKFRALHKIGPARLQFLRDEMVRHFGLPSAGMRPLTGLGVLDVGCGGSIRPPRISRQPGAMRRARASPSTIEPGGWRTCGRSG
jgi:2-polyprenyl-6-hydroxyphenyl methylase/3-demethylubiquinone-9 3-methyltransferase